VRTHLAIASVLACSICIAGGIRYAHAEDLQTDAAPRRVKVLFLGDNGHHQPLERCRDVYSVLAKRGIDLTYTDDLNDLNSQTLGRYDVLLLYANWAAISPEQEKALLDYVQSGHGFAPIHCASYCFLNSPMITALIGARFKRHSTGVFKETIADPNHPIEKGLKPIESWDETYVHEMHNEKDRRVLSYRIDGGHKEPYTWVRTEGKGRVFYTAWGHDQRTWGNPDFQDLLERGIRWSAGDWALAPQPKLPPFKYVEAKVPSYVPGAAWGTTGTPIAQMQEPLSPRESMRHMVVPPGFALKLFASEPRVKKPICLAFDERGRLWVAETFDYPNNMQPPGQGHDQITICEDTKGEGIADKFTIFADKLSIPTSMVFANGGVIVSQAPDMLFLKSSRGDDHADVRKVLFTGFGTRDTHAGPSNLRWGFDNWIYGTCGYSGFDGQVGGQHVAFGQGVFRFKPDGSSLEFLGSTTNNTWGLGLSEDGQVFGSTANGNPAWYLHIPNRYYEQVAGWPATRLESIADTWHFWPITDKVRQVDWFGGYTAGAGSALYTARSFPSSYWNRVTFVAEPTGHLLGQFLLQPDGGDYRARNEFNLLASDDEWAAPIAAEVGPDGALWIIDWYNYIVQHNPIPRGWKGGKGGAYETPLRDKRHGRVYRLIWEAGKPSNRFDLQDASSQTLIEALHSDNMLWRMHAQRLLVERGDKSAIAALGNLIDDPSLDAIGLNPAAAHALWAIHGLGGFDGSNAGATAVAIRALHHPSGGVRKAAVDVLPRTAESADAIVSGHVLADPDPQVRKSSLLALSEMPPSTNTGAAIYATVTGKQNSTDRWITDAAAIAAAHDDAGFLHAAFAAHPGNSSSSSPGHVQLAHPSSDGLAGAERRVIAIVLKQYAHRGPVDSVVPTLQAIQHADPALATVAVDALAGTWPKDASPTLSDVQVSQIREVMKALPMDARDRMLLLAQRWGRRDLFANESAAVLDALRASVADASGDASTRVDAARRLISVDDGAATDAFILKQVSPREPPDLQVGLLDALGASKAGELANAIVDRYGQLAPVAQREAINLLLRRDARASALLDAVQSGKIDNRDLLPQQWSALGDNPDERIADRAKALQKSTGHAPTSDRKAIVEKFLPVANQSGDKDRGKLVFEQNCMVCHTLDGRGGKVGPELTGIGLKPRPELLHKVLDPNSSVEGTYRQWIVKTKSGDVIAGRIYAESRTSIELIDAAAKQYVLQRDDIDQLKPTPKTLMPEGFEQLGQDKLADLLAYLQTSKVKR